MLNRRVLPINDLVCWNVDAMAKPSVAAARAYLPPLTLPLLVAYLAVGGLLLLVSDVRKRRVSHTAACDAR